ncbi:hypothetical protein ACINCANBC1_1273 [Acinetobacter baumannii Canada BC1]|nr:hypothetical protein ACINCANBC1_1273 [Acinetobacter baumannii Canada BC1]
MVFYFQLSRSSWTDLSLAFVCRDFSARKGTNSKVSLVYPLSFDPQKTFLRNWYSDSASETFLVQMFLITSRELLPAISPSTSEIFFLHIERMRLDKEFLPSSLAIHSIFAFSSKVNFDEAFAKSFSAIHTSLLISKVKPLKLFEIAFFLFHGLRTHLKRCLSDTPHFFECSLKFLKQNFAQSPFHHLLLVGCNRE